jgi:hypothetical protein
MFPEDIGHLGVRRKSSRASSVKTAIDASQLRWRCLILALSKACLDLKRNLRELGLGLFGPLFRAFQNVREYFCGHASIIHQMTGAFVALPRGIEPLFQP